MCRTVVVGIVKTNFFCRTTIQLAFIRLVFTGFFFKNLRYPEPRTTCVIIYKKKKSFRRQKIELVFLVFSPDAFRLKFKSANCTLFERIC